MSANGCNHAAGRDKIWQVYRGGKVPIWKHHCGIDKIAERIKKKKKKLKPKKCISLRRGKGRQKKIKKKVIGKQGRTIRYRDGRLQMSQER